MHVSNGQRNYGEGAATDNEDRPRNRFGFFGQMVDNKGVWVLLQAVEHLRAEGFTDFVVELNGDNRQFASEQRRNELEAFLEREREKPIAEQNVVFNGSYHTEQLAARMSRVDWCIVPSVWWETFALVISEAWMFRRPVIASNVGAPGERIRHEVDGLLFPGRRRTRVGAHDAAGVHRGGAVGSSGGGDRGAAGAGDNGGEVLRCVSG